jgi:hypothetical protein
MQKIPADQRRLMACGYEPPVEGARAWTHPGQEPRFEGDPIATVCPGYTTKLPAVIDVAIARLHWQNGELAGYARGEPSEQLMSSIAAYDASSNEMQRWLLTPKSEGGGGPG